jgi:DNA-binding GntR family transcriptional regulator
VTEDHGPALVRLLEEDDVEGAHAFLVQHLADAQDEIVQALGLT